MKKLTLATSILLSVGSEIMAKPVSYLPNLNTFQPVLNSQKMRKWDGNIPPIDRYNSGAEKVIYNEERLRIESYGSTPDASTTESIQIKKRTKMENATILHKANEFVKKGNYESFLAYCT